MRKVKVVQALDWIEVAVAVAIVLLILSGCMLNPTHSYYVQRCVEKDVCTEMKIKSKLEFEEITIMYNKDAGAFDFRASNVSATESALETMAAELIPELINRAVPGG